MSFLCPWEVCFQHFFLDSLGFFPLPATSVPADTTANVTSKGRSLRPTASRCFLTVILEDATKSIILISARMLQKRPVPSRSGFSKEKLFLYFVVIARAREDGRCAKCNIANLVNNSSSLGAPTQTGQVQIFVPSLALML